MKLLQLFLLILCVQISDGTNGTTPQTYCSSRCLEYVKTCYDATPSGCRFCNLDLFHQLPIDHECQLLDQYSIAHELTMNGMNLTDYQISTSAPTTCDSYILSGENTGNQSYFSRHFTSLTPSHYQLILKFSIGYIGEWDGTQTLHISIDNTTYSTPVICDFNSDLCSGSGSDCFKTITIIDEHNSTSANINISVTMPTDNPAIQYWGIKDLLLAEHQCSGACQTCFGAATDQCLTCRQNYYLEGNKCVQHCKYKGIFDARECTDVCPQAYYTDGDICLRCEEGCAICSDADHCALWVDGTVGNSVWNQYMLLWILIIIAAGVLIFLVCHRCLIGKDKILDDNDDNIEEHMISEQEAGNQGPEFVQMESIEKKKEAVRSQKVEERNFKKKKRRKIQEDIPPPVKIQVGEEHFH